MNAKLLGVANEYNFPVCQLAVSELLGIWFVRIRKRRGTWGVAKR